jgi:oligosaccharide repeat unit polymerase
LLGLQSSSGEAKKRRYISDVEQNGADWAFHECLKVMQIDRVEPAGHLTRSLTTPFAAYAAGFAVAISVYSLGYSDLYPLLQPSLKWFLLSTSLICAYLANATGKIVHIPSYAQERFGMHLIIFALICAVFSAEVVVSGGIPLLHLAPDSDLRYKDFGIPTLHVAFVGFCYFFAVYWFDLYVLGRGKKYLILFMPALVSSLLILNRGAFITMLIAITVVYIRRRGFDRRLLLTFAAVAALVGWGFGYLGELRSNGASGESAILAIGKPSDKFLNSNVPTELFWTYLYTSSPLANLQLNITDRTAADSPLLYFLLEFLPDFVSKRVVSKEVIEAAVPLLNTEELNVSTMYGRSFLLMGWLGLFLNFLYFIVVSAVCLKLLQRSRYFVAALGILSAIAFLDIFDNMFIAAGGIVPVLVALLLHLFERGSAPDGLAIDHAGQPSRR